MSDDQTKYVAGFLFSPNLETVALIRKNKPKWQAGLLNGIGGKIEHGETPFLAMAREFAEETTHDPVDWFHVGILTDKASFSVVFFAAIGDPLNCKSREAEQVEVIEVRGIHPLRRDMIENLPWLIPLAIDMLEDHRPALAQIEYPLSRSHSAPPATAHSPC